MLALGAVLVLFVLYTVYYGRVTDFWFEETLDGTLTAADVDQIASSFVTNLDARIITPEGTTTYAPGETARLRADVHGLLDPLVGRDAGPVRTYVSDDVGECEADFGDTHVKLNLLPTDIGHATSTLEVRPR